MTLANTLRISGPLGFPHEETNMALIGGYNLPIKACLFNQGMFYGWILMLVTSASSMSMVGEKLTAVWEFNWLVTSVI